MGDEERWKAMVSKGKDQAQAAWLVVMLAGGMRWLASVAVQMGSRGFHPPTFRRTRYVGKVPCSFASGVWPT